MIRQRLDNFIFATICRTIELANRFITGLSFEKTCWTENIDSLHSENQFILGDSVLLAGFCCYLGSLTSQLRTDLLAKWTALLNNSGSLALVPSANATSDPSRLLANEAVTAEWANEGLPNELVSVQNAALLLLASGSRWPLVVDPQLQALRWLQAHFRERLILLDTAHLTEMDSLAIAMTRGDALLIDISGSFGDSSLDGLLNYIGQRVQANLNDVSFSRHFFKLVSAHYSIRRSFILTFGSFCTPKTRIHP